MAGRRRLCQPPATNTSVDRKNTATKYDAAGDGNCFFHAVSIAMPDAGIQQSSADTLRESLVDHFRSSSTNKYSSFIADPSSVGETEDMPCAADTDMAIASIPCHADRQKQMWYRYLIDWKVVLGLTMWQYKE